MKEELARSPPVPRWEDEDDDGHEEEDDEEGKEKSEDQPQVEEVEGDGRDACGGKTAMTGDENSFFE